ncbi:MAG: hypothetical protein N4J56_001878 [Chroococcidiopsis sp. SAG 2025]|nr:hypothetical protein [Chroococcidiopsis sp. SAG 2025]
MRLNCNKLECHLRGIRAMELILYASQILCRPFSNISHAYFGVYWISGILFSRGI